MKVITETCFSTLNLIFTFLFIMKWDSSPNFYLFLSRNLGLEKEWIVCLEYKTLNITATCTWYRSMILVLDTALCDKFVSDLQQVGGFLRILRFPPPIKLTTMIFITEILLKVAKKNLHYFECLTSLNWLGFFVLFFLKIIVFSDIKIWRYLTTILFNDNRAIYRNNFICQHLSCQLITIIAFCNSWQSLNIVIFQLNSIGN